MADIEKLIQDLQSDDLEIRYNACKQLEIEPQLPKEAIEALRAASNDPDPLIAVAANRTLGRHKSKIPSTLYTSESQVPGEVITKKPLPLLDIQNQGLILLSAITAFFGVTGYSIYYLPEMTGPGPVDTESYIAGYGIYCMIGVGVSFLAAFITSVYLNYWRNRFPRFIDVLLSLTFGLVSILVGLYVGFVVGI